MRKLATAALSFSAAVYLAHFLLPKTVWLYIAAVLFLTAIILAVFLRGETRLRALLISFSACAGLLISLGSSQIRNAPASELTGYEGPIRAEITDFSRVYDEYGYSTVELRLKTDGMPGLKAKLYSYDYDISALTPGDIIETTAVLRAADTRAGEKYDRYNADGIYLFATAKDEVTLSGRSKAAFVYAPKHIGRSIEQSALRVFSSDTVPLLTALLTGNKELLYDDVQLYSNMSAAGILHVVAVSGMHVAFLVGFVQSVLRKKRIAAVVSIVIVWLFVPVAGATPSVVRAAFMQTTALIAPLLRRENDAITSLSAILTLLLFINPDACASVSLQLSFAAMLCMITVTPRIYRSVIRHIPKSSDNKPAAVLFSFGRGAGASLAATIGALALSTPLAAMHFGSMSLAGIIVNVLIFWIVSLCFVLGYVSCLAGILWLPLGKLLGAVCSVLARLIIAVVNAAASVPYASLYTEGTAFGWWLVMVYIIYILCFVFRRKKGFRPVIPLCLALCSLCAVVIFSEAARANQKPQMTVLDVGQGQSIIAEDGDATVIIDCGGRSGERNAGELAAAKLLGQGRRSADVLALTHLDDDHCNGVLRLMSRVRIDRLLLPYDGESTAVRQSIVDFAREHGTEVYIITEDTNCAVGNISLEAYVSKSLKKPELMYLCSFGDDDVLITGDAYGADERYFLKTHQMPPVEVYIAGHHGSKYSSSEELLSALDARWAVISSGYNNYGHPAPETLERLSAAGMEILRTDQLSDVTLKME